MAQAPQRGVSQDEFLEAMSRLATGVVMVTGCVDGRPWGMTVSACCSVSADPPTLLVSLSRQTVLARAIRDNRRFGVCVLGEEALELARFGSAPGAPKFLDGVCELSGEETAPGVEGALAHADCDVAKIVQHGTHALFLGEVRSLTVQGEDRRWSNFQRDFRQLAVAA